MVDVAVVTGGAGGLGRLVTLALVEQSLHVLAVDWDISAGEALEAEAHGRVTFIAADVTDAGDLSRAAGHASAIGDLVVLVNNAGGWLPGPQFPDSDRWQESIELNLVGPMLATQVCLRAMAAAGGGAVVNVSSSGGWDSAAYGSPEYGASKAGLIRFTTAVQDFHSRFGVRVSCVVPHWIGLDRAVAEYEALDPQARRASGGLIEPRKVVGAIVDLIADPASAGKVVVVRADRDPYPVDPASYDPTAATA